MSPTLRAARPDEVVVPVAGPPLPMGQRVPLQGRGTTFVREIAGPPGAPTVLLLHGWIASGGLNWFTAFDALGEQLPRARARPCAATGGASARAGASAWPTAPTTPP